MNDKTKTVFCICDAKGRAWSTWWGWIEGSEIPIDIFTQEERNTHAPLLQGERWEEL